MLYSWHVSASACPWQCVLEVVVNMLDKLLSVPLVAILRGILPDEVEQVGLGLADLGYRCIEVPLNSPEPLLSVERLANSMPEDVLVGAGTVVSVEQVEQVKKAGAGMVFSPNCDVDVIKATKALGMVSIPGCATVSEAYHAINAGADALKLFPAQQLTPSVIKSIKEVLPVNVPLLAVGGIDASNMHAFLQVGVTGFGLGGALYRKGKALDDVLRDGGELLTSFKRSKND